MISILVDTVERAGEIIAPSFRASLMLTNEVDTVDFQYRKYGARSWVPAFDQDVEIYDGATKIFGGKISEVQQMVESGGAGVLYSVRCIDHTFEADRALLSGIFEGDTIQEIIINLVGQVNTKLGLSGPAAFSTDNVAGEFIPPRLVFNQVPLSFCLRKLAAILANDWYFDADKDLHFFTRETNAAPFALSDTSGNYNYTSLKLGRDGAPVCNLVKVLGGTYDGDAFTDTITVSGDDSKAFVLPYRFSNLEIELDTGAGYVSKNVGIDNIDSFLTDDVLYNFDNQSIRFENDLADGDRIRFTGNPKIPVRAIAQDDASVAIYGPIEKLVRDDRIVATEVARRRAAAELLTYATEVVSASFDTQTAGLMPGQLLTVQSTKRSINENLLIKSVTFGFLDPYSFTYNVQLISTQEYSLIDLLRKIVEPEPRADDDRESAEELFTASDEMELGEEMLLDPVDTGDIVWVWGPYAPTSDSDVNRANVANGGATWG